MFRFFQKKKLLLIVFGLLLGLGIVGTFWGPDIIEAASFWGSCRKTNDLCYYPGDCRSYIDTNGDGICDRSQPEPSATVTESPAAVEQDTETETDMVTTAVTTETADSEEDTPASVTPVTTETATSESETAVATPGSLYYFLPIFLPVIILYAITWLLSKRKMIPLSLHRKIWNYVLLVPALVSCIFGIILTAEIEFGTTVNLPFNILFWHVEAGIIMGTVSVLHIAWHWKYFMKALKFAREDK